MLDEQNSGAARASAWIRGARPRSGQYISPDEAHEQVAAMRRYQSERTTRLVQSARGLSPLIVKAAAVGAGVSVESAWGHVLKAMSVPAVRDDANQVAAWKVLKPHAGSTEIAAHGMSHPWHDATVAVGFIAIGRLRGRPAVSEGAWSLDFTDYCLEQTAQAGAPDLAQMMLDAHSLLLSAPVSLASDLMASASCVLPAGPGAFLLRMRAVLLGEGDTAMLATASDWLPVADLTDAQRQQATRIKAEHSERTLGERWLLPAPMRPACRPFRRSGDAAPACKIPI